MKRKRTESRLGREVVCPPDLTERLDRALAQLVPDLSRGEARRLIADGAVFIDGVRCRIASRQVHGGMHLRVAGPSGPSKARLLPVLLEDDDCLVIDKPSGMPAAPTRLRATGTALDEARRQLADRKRVDTSLWLVHRLDAPTSGVLLFAKSQPAAAALGRAFRNRDVTKTYFARVAGVVAETSGLIDLPLRNARGRAVVATAGQAAETEWEVIRRGAESTVLRLRPRTGRFHQLRAHLHAIGHPIIGDRLYGGPPAPRLMLHAATLRFRHPRTGAAVEVAAPVPADLELT